MPVVDDLEELLLLVAVAHPTPQVEGFQGVLDEAQDLPLLVLERAMEHEAVAHVDDGALAPVGQGETPDARLQELLDPVGQPAQVGGHEGHRGLGAAAASQEEQEAIALALVAGEDVALAKPLLHLLEHGVDLRAQALVGGPPEAALDVSEGPQVHEHGPQAALLAQDLANLVVRVAERDDRHQKDILRPGPGHFKPAMRRPPSGRPHGAPRP